MGHMERALEGMGQPTPENEKKSRFLDALLNHEEYKSVTNGLRVSTRTRTECVIDMEIIQSSMKAGRSSENKRIEGQEEMITRLQAELAAIKNHDMEEETTMNAMYEDEGEDDYMSAYLAYVAAGCKGEYNQNV